MIISQDWVLWINVMAVLILFGNTFFGYKNGLLATVYSIVSFVIVYVVAYLLSPGLTKICPIHPFFPKEIQLYLRTLKIDTYIDQVLWFIISLVFLKVLSNILYHIFKRVHEIPVYHAFSALFGAIVGFFEGLALCFILLFVLQSGLFKNGKDISRQTILKPIQSTSELAYRTTMEQKWFDDLKIDWHTYQQKFREMRLK
ncbi:CvpA family protein [Bulleidia sp. zg-1006]|uniref:CvpA family protein n=1 Tax=Bulleidia sp. zg-1006 TaxID=2806552 RepID=UPI001939BB57|nr:CvpA family protein [Bulleidia sp. zg-1006]QRG87416.1 CvpA family protein [Bulleidia sp. zg-1006]